MGEKEGGGWGSSAEHTNTNTEEGECVRERNRVEHPRGFESKYIQSVHFIIYIFSKHAANICTTGRRLGCGHAFIKEKKGGHVIAMLKT